MINIKRCIPNIISCFRIAFALTLPFLLRREWDIEVTLPLFNEPFTNVPIVWLIVYIIILSTDKIDGSLARKFKVETALGAVLDTLGDALTLAIGAVLCFIRFGSTIKRADLISFYIVVITIILSKIFVFILAKIYHGKGNMLHSYYHKAFAISCYPAIVIWMFTQTIPPWTIYVLITIMMFAIIDESIYCVRTAEYNVDFKGHGFETYKKRN